MKINRSLLDLRLAEFEERSDAVSKGVANEGHERSCGHKGRSQNCQDTPSDPDASKNPDGQNGDHHHTEAYLIRAGWKKIHCEVIRIKIYLFFVKIVFFSNAYSGKRPSKMFEEVGPLQKRK